MAKKKKQSMIKDAIILCMISLIAALALGFVNELTKDKIAALEAEKKAEAYRVVFAEGAKFVEASENEILATAMNDAADILAAGGHSATINEACIVEDAAGENIGYVATVTVSAFNTMKLIVGYTTDGVCTGVEILVNAETKAGAETPEFRGQFVGKKVEQFVAVKGAAAENEIDIVSGVTVSSKGIVNGVNAGIYFLSELNNRVGGAN